jgi:branched-chain amino acid transport system permease protein
MTMTLFLQSILAGLTNGFVDGLIGLGIAVVCRGARIINAMQGDFALLGSVVAYVALTGSGSDATGVSFRGPRWGVLGLLVERLLIRPTEKRAGTEDSYLLVTLGGLLQRPPRCCSISDATRTCSTALRASASVDVLDAAIRAARYG